MHLLYVGLTHKKTSLSVLEIFHFSDRELEDALLALHKEKSILENIIISTCNRTELYLIVDQLHTGRYYGKHFLAKCFQQPVEELESHLVFKEGDAALAHLFRLAAGLESKIIGETQILGQVKQAFLKAQELEVTGVIFKEISKRVLTFAKDMHSQFHINARPASISLTAMQLLDELGFDFTGKSVAIIGLGEIGQLLTKYALVRNFQSISLVNRTTSKADKFLLDERVKVYPFEQLAEAVATADVVFSAVKVEDYILFSRMLREGAIVFDLCLPRTVQPSDAIQLYNIENLSNQLEHHQAKRQEIAEQIALQVNQEVLDFNEWRRQLGIVPLIAEIREKALAAQAEAMDSLLRKIPDLTAREQKQIAKHMKSIINQIIKEPILQLKEMSVGENSDYDIALICKIFGLHQVKGGGKNEDD